MFRFLVLKNNHSPLSFPKVGGATFFPFSQGWGPLFLFLDEKIKFAKRKIKAASERAKTPAFRLNGNELAALKQISVLIAFLQGFLTLAPTMSILFAARLRHRLSFGLFASQRRLSSRECAALFLSFCSRWHRIFLLKCLWGWGEYSIFS